MRIKNVPKGVQARADMVPNVLIDQVPPGMWFKATGWDQYWKIVSKSLHPRNFHVTSSGSASDNPSWVTSATFTVNVYPNQVFPCEL
jgi:anaerobic selenocysteine-containing dehydrogenase